jgi:photosystem II stability/assembly factor-like uncharacterized protein
MDGGEHWTPVNLGLTHSSVLSLAVNFRGEIFAGTDGGGVFRSTDNGSTWTQTGLKNIEVRSLAINSAGHLFAGTIGGGVYRSTDNGKNWIEVNNGLTHPYILTIAINSAGHIFAGCPRDGLFRSTKNGGNCAGCMGRHSYCWAPFDFVKLALHASCPVIRPIPMERGEMDSPCQSRRNGRG